MSRADEPASLENRAAIFVESEGGYVDIQQEFGNHTKYTPEEARRIAREIMAAADAAETTGHVTAEDLDPEPGPP
jgi:hypothetical protein